MGARVANIYYKGRLIVAYATLHPSTNLWSAGAEITWKKDAERLSYTIGGLAERFPSAAEAERFAVELARRWIDANP
jgi:hypothetical protein